MKQLISASAERVKHGDSLVREANETMRDIVRAVQDVTTIMAEISRSSQEQSDGVDQVNIALMDMDQGAQANSVQVEQAAEISAQLATQARQLSNAVGIFKVAAKPANSRLLR
ncbi:methyl-accepting chemotaxis protein [Massilia sp. W12]|uniref:methyl-accepting chemotaxis protein n=1 Tax=Massilia sp. W12 TaxID=3126507 RepID=UPI0030D01F9D